MSGNFTARAQSPLWPSPSPPPEPQLPGRAHENPYFMGVYQAKMPGYTETKPPEAFMNTHEAIFPNDAERDDPNIIQPRFSYPDKPAPKGCRRRKRIRPLPENAKPIRLPSRMATLLEAEERGAEAEDQEVRAQHSALDVEQPAKKRRSGNQAARNQRRLARRKEVDNSGDITEDNCNVDK
jgi:hypothetical protein